MEVFVFFPALQYKHFCYDFVTCHGSFFLRNGFFQIYKHKRATSISELFLVVLSHFVIVFSVCSFWYTLWWNLAKPCKTWRTLLQLFLSHTVIHFSDSRHIVVLVFLTNVIYLFKVSNGKTRILCEIRLKLEITTLERCQWRCYGVFIVTFDQISYNVGVS